MSQIRGRDTKPEMLLRRALWAAGMRYRIRNSLPGKPDIVFLSAKVAVFVDGCFWHGCPEHMTWPKSNADFWLKKIEKNKQRDHDVSESLKKIGWAFSRIWEHEIYQDLKQAVSKVEMLVRNN